MSDDSIIIRYQRGERDFSRIALSGTNLSGADLSRANLSRANLNGANLNGANLSKANLSRANLSGANLSRANLSGADLNGANLSGANLSGANLKETKLFWADLNGASLREAKLREADLSGADLSGANLSGANLSGANLSGANLSGAYLEETKLFGADLHSIYHSLLHKPSEASQMQRYIIIPKSSPSITQLSNKLSFSDNNRSDLNEILGELTKERQALSEVKELAAWLLDAQSSQRAAVVPLDTTHLTMSGALAAAGQQVGLPLSGALFIDADLSTKEELDALLGQHFSILRDEPISLITPEQLKLADMPPEDREWHLEAIGLLKQRKTGFTGTGDGISVAVMDTGIEGSHAELEGRLLGGFQILRDGEGSKIVPQTPSFDHDGHGTHVAGLIAGKSVGVAPGSSLKSIVILPHDRPGMLSDFLIALEWIVQEPDVRVVNISAGSTGFYPEFGEVLHNLMHLGILPVCAVGNDGENRSCSPGNHMSPISVGAMTRQNRIASFSGSGSLLHNSQMWSVPSVVAPGHSIYSCVNNNGYAVMSGTSMATPIVSGLAALLLERKERNSKLDAFELRDEIFNSCLALKLPPTRQGRGLVQFL